MSKLIYSGLMSLDGYTVDDRGSFDWAAPDAQVHAFVNELERPIGTYLYGRRMYETMKYWESPPVDDSTSEIERDYTAIWQAADKIVYSKTLETPSSARTRIDREFDPDAIRTLKATAERDIGIGGPHLASAAIAAGLVDELDYFLTPIVVGGGTPFLPSGVRFTVELLDEHRFAGGVVHLRYRVR